MMQEEFLGVNSSDQLGEIIDKFNPNKILLVRGKSSYASCGAKLSIEKALCGKNIEIVEYFDFQENPKIEDVEIGLELLKSHDIDLIIGIGGGSVLDMSKMLRFFYSYSYDSSFSRYSKQRDIFPLIALPTTSGTGCESTHFAVVYKDKVKYSIAHKDVLPDIAVVDPIFTYDLPKYSTACTGFDALSQAIEAYWNVNATEESDKYAIEAIKLLYPNLPIVVNNPTELIRDIISKGSHLAGKAINITKTTAPHAFSYPFTTYYGYPHGHAVALTFPFFMEYNYGNNKNFLHQEKMNILYKLMGIKEIEDISVVFVEYLRNIKLLKRDDNFSLNLIFDNVNLERLSNNPVEVTSSVKEAIRIY